MGFGRFALGAALALAVVLSGCVAQRQPVEVTAMPEGRVVGNAEGDHMLTMWYTANKLSKGSLSTVMRAFDDGGKLGVCGAYVLAGHDQARAIMRTQLQSPVSRVRFGDKVALAPMLFRENAPPVAEIPGADVPLKLNELQANCVRVDVPWDEAFRKPPSLLIANRRCASQTCY